MNCAVMLTIFGIHFSSKPHIFYSINVWLPGVCSCCDASIAARTAGVATYKTVTPLLFTKFAFPNRCVLIQ